jgi:hypothetical protein
MKATTEGIEYVLRLHVNDDAEYGDDYIGGAIVSVDEQRVANIRCLSSTLFNKEAVLAIEDALWRINVKEAFWTQRRNGLLLPRRFPVRIPGDSQ